MLSHTPFSKSKRPGVSIILNLILSYSNVASFDERVVCLLTSSGSKSQTVLPSATFPSLSVAFALKRRASASEVLPEPAWPAMAIFLMFSELYCFI